MTVTAIIARYGLLAVLLGAGIEGETVVATGGLLAHQGLLPLGGVMAAAAAGSFVADQIFFQVGRRCRDHPRTRRLAERPAFRRALAMLERRPTGFIFAFRFLYGLRTISPMAIGAAGVPMRRFVVLNLLAAAVWAAAVAGVGYGFGGSVELAFGRLRRIEHVAAAAAALVLAAAGVAWLARRRIRR